MCNFLKFLFVSLAQTNGTKRVFHRKRYDICTTIPSSSALTLPLILSCPVFVGLPQNASVVLLAMVVLILRSSVVVHEIHSKRGAARSQARKSTLESVPAGEGPLVSPSLTVCSGQLSSPVIGWVGQLSYARSQGSYRGWPAASL